MTFDQRERANRQTPLFLLPDYCFVLLQLLLLLLLFPSRSIFRAMSAKVLGGHIALELKARVASAKSGSLPKRWITAAMGSREHAVT